MLTSRSTTASTIMDAAKTNGRNKHQGKDLNVNEKTNSRSNIRVPTENAATNKVADAIDTKQPEQRHASRKQSTLPQMVQTSLATLIVGTPADIAHDATHTQKIAESRQRASS